MVDEVGVGPHPEPWPDDARLDPELLAGGDRRNVVDRYRYWLREAIVADLDGRRHPFHVAVENWDHDFNIGTVVRNANAFMAAGVHIVGRRRWNRRGAMVTDRYQHVAHHPDVADLVAWAATAGLAVVGHEDQDRLLLDGQLGQLAAQTAEVLVDVGDHAIERRFWNFGVTLVGLLVLVRNQIRTMRSVGGDEGEERLVAAGLDGAPPSDRRRAPETVRLSAS